MKSKYAFLIVLGLATAVAGYSYYDDVSISRSEAAGYAVTATHVNGPQTYTVGENIVIRWPRNMAGTSDYPAKVFLLVYEDSFSANNQPLINTQELSMNVTSNRFRWMVGGPVGGIMVANSLGKYMQFRVVSGKYGENQIDSAPFTIVEPPAYPSY